MSINDINAALGNITDIEEQQPERAEVWKDIKISFQQPKNRDNFDFELPKSNTEFVMWDKLEKNLDERVETLLSVIKGRMTAVNQDILKQFLFESYLSEKTDGDNKWKEDKMKEIINRLEAEMIERQKKK